MAGAGSRYANRVTGPRLHEGAHDARGLRVAVVAARFNAFVTDRLLTGAVDALVRMGAEPSAIELVRVPGAFELPAAVAALARRGSVDAVVALGCLIRGDTLHFDVLANEATHGLAEVARTSGVAVGFGLLTTDTMEQAIDRAGGKAGNKGAEAATAAVELARVLASVTG